jgi:mannose-6-phosphate isomerase-like protein (cupin superfamily)
MDIQPLRRDQLTFENGLFAQRLLPWAALNAPFEGSWCVIKPGTSSTPHAHHEYEIFIALRGEARLHSNGSERSFVAGDIVHFEPHEEHAVVNVGSEDFEMYSIWWDADMTERFQRRHREAA